MVDELILPTAKSYVTALITGISMNDGNGIWSSQDGNSGRSSVFILRVLINRVRYSCAYTGQKVAPGIRVYIIFTIICTRLGRTGTPSNHFYTATVAVAGGDEIFKLISLHGTYDTRQLSSLGVLITTTTIALKKPIAPGARNSEPYNRTENHSTIKSFTIRCVTVERN